MSFPLFWLLLLWIFSIYFYVFSSMRKKWMLKEFPSEVTQETFPRLWKWRKQQWNNEKDGICINRKRNRSDTRLVKISLKDHTWWLDLDLKCCYLHSIFSLHSTMGAFFNWSSLRHWLILTNGFDGVLLWWTTLHLDKTSC